MFLGFLVTSAKESRHLEVPAPERAIRRACLKARIDLEHRFELALDLASILETLPQSERFGERAHIRRDPEMTFRPIRVNGDRLARSGDAAFERRTTRALLRFVIAEPVAHA